MSTNTLRKALERLSAAALARDSTMGDPCALLAAKAELADANKAACEALAAPMPEPVAKFHCYEMVDVGEVMLMPHTGPKLKHGDLLYAAPPAAPAPVVPEGDVVVSWNEEGQIVAVTRQDEEGRILSVIAESAAPVVREPQPTPRTAGCLMCGHCAATGERVVRPAVPLTDEQLARIAVEDEFLLYCDQDSFNEIARAIEQAHGIGGGGK